MKKNYYWSIMIATIMAVMSAGFVSCGDDDDDGNDEVINGGSISKIDPVQERLKPFIGLWDIKANDYYHYVTFPDYRILFFQDSKCVILKKENEKIHNLLSWDYDESNKYLSIAGEAKGQWQITSVGDNAWTGLALWYGGNNAYSAEKQTVRNVMDYYYDGSTWMSDSVKATFELNEYYDALNSHHRDIYFTVHKHHSNGEKYVTYKFNLTGLTSSQLYENPENDIIVIDKGNQKGTEICNIQLVHPYSYKDVYMNVHVKDKYDEFSGKFMPQRK